MTPVHVFLDANALLADPALQGTAFRLIRAALSRTAHRVLVPESVLAEAEPKLPAACATAVSEISKSLGVLERIIGHGSMAKVKEGLETATKVLTPFRERLIALRVTISPCPA